MIYKLHNRLYLVKHLQGNKIFFVHLTLHLQARHRQRPYQLYNTIVVMCKVTYKKVCTIKLSLSLLSIFNITVVLLLLFLSQEQIHILLVSFPSYIDLYL